MKIKKTSQILKTAYFQSLSKLSPGKLLPTVIKPYSLKSRVAVLCWGKAAWQSFQAYRELNPKFATAFVIAPETPSELVHGERLSVNVTLCVGEHPVPRKGSFHAGMTLLQWLKQFNEKGVTELKVLLSGGASSLAWLPPVGLPSKQVSILSEKLYRLPLGIAELNRRRAEICMLKGGGTARIVQMLSPTLKVSVDVISDVLPFGIEVIGSGPFWHSESRKRPPHRVLADNETFVFDFCNSLSSKEKIISFSAGRSGSWNEWVKNLSDAINKNIRAGKSGTLVMGGESHVSVPQNLARPQGGRLTQIALALLIKHWDDFQNGNLELLCGSSDGVDGRSGGAGVYLDAQSVKRGRCHKKVAIQALKNFNAGWFFHEMKALLPEGYTGTNVQDLVAVRILKK